MRNGKADIVEKAVQHGANPDAKYIGHSKSQKNHTILQYAAKLTNSDHSRIIYPVVEVLVRYGAKISTSDTPTIGSPLKCAFLSGNLDLLKLFLKHGAKFEGPDWKNTSPMQLAFEMLKKNKLSVEMLRLLIVLGLFDPTHRDNRGHNLLHVFLDGVEQNCEVVTDRVAIAEIFLDLGIPVDEVDSDGNTPLHRVVNINPADRMALDCDLASLFVKRGANVNLRSGYYGRLCPLSAAVIKGNKKIVKMLLLNGADVHAAHHDAGYTALHVACSSSKSTYLIDLLIKSGADVNATDVFKRTPADLLKIYRIPYKFKR